MFIEPASNKSTPFNVVIRICVSVSDKDTRPLDGQLYATPVVVVRTPLSTQTLPLKLVI